MKNEDILEEDELPEEEEIRLTDIERRLKDLESDCNKLSKCIESIDKDNRPVVDYIARNDIQLLSAKIEKLKTPSAVDTQARKDVDSLSMEVQKKADQISVTRLSDRINVLESASTSLVDHQARQDINTLSLRVEELETKPDKDINARQGVEQLSLVVQGKADKNEVETLKGTATALKNTIATLATRVEKLEKSTKSSIDRDAWNKIEKEVDDLSSRMNSPGNRNSRKLGVCLFLCAVLLFNILVIWFITCMPTGGSIEWLFLLPLLAVTVIDAVCVALLSYRIIVDACENAWVGVSAAIALLVLNIVAIWLFAFYPSELTAAVYALLVFLMVANIAEGVATVFYSYGNENGYIPSIFTFIALLPVLIIFIGWIRV